MSELLYDPTKLFKFNLIPPKSKEELNVLENRDNSILYSFLLVFFGMLIFFILNLAQTFAITPQLNSAELTIANQKLQVEAYDQVHQINGELFVKSQSLEPILEKDIKFSEVLTASKEVSNKFPDSFITTYSREATGEFVLDFVIGTPEDAIKLVKEMRTNTKFMNTFVRSLGHRSDDLYTVTVAFILNTRSTNG